MRRFIRFLIGALLLLSAPIFSFADNNFVYPTGQVFTLGVLTWGTTGTANGFNNNFLFTPLNPGNECITVTILNNNPTSAHTFRVFILQTGQIPSASVPLSLPVGLGPTTTWPQVATSGNTSGSASAATFPGLYNLSGQITGGVAQVAIQFADGAVQAGSPDTATVIVTQTQGSCNQTQQNAYGVQPDFPGLVTAISNNEFTSAIASAISTVTAGTSGFPARGILFSVSARCSAGTAQLIVKDGATQIWSTAATEVGTTTFRYQWNPGLLSSIGQQLTIQLSSCGAGNTGIIDVQTSAVRVSQ